MLAANFEQEIFDDIGLFGRLSWNDGQSQSWMYTEQDRAVSLGLSFGGANWGRPKDTIGLATNVGWISDAHRRFLEAGGIGFITGDGRLNYAPEWLTELYYDVRLAPGINAALDYQYLANPGYNADRGLQAGGGGDQRLGWVGPCCAAAEPMLQARRRARDGRSAGIIRSVPAWFALQARDYFFAPGRKSSSGTPKLLSAHDTRLYWPMVKTTSTSCSVE